MLIHDIEEVLLIAVAVTVGAFLLTTIFISYLASFHLPGQATWNPVVPELARCKHCKRQIQSCRHANGVPSTWEHVYDRSHWCNGELVEHR